MDGARRADTRPAYDSYGRSTGTLPTWRNWQRTALVMRRLGVRVPPSAPLPQSGAPHAEILDACTPARGYRRPRSVSAGPTVDSHVAELPAQGGEGAGEQAGDVHLGDADAGGD